MGLTAPDEFSPLLPMVKKLLKLEVMLGARECGGVSVGGCMDRLDSCEDISPVVVFFRAT